MRESIDHCSEYNITVYDLEKCVSFYKDKLGLGMKQHEKEYAHFAFGETGMGLALISIDVANRLSPRQISLPAANEPTRRFYLSRSPTMKGNAKS